MRMLSKSPRRPESANALAAALEQSINPGANTRKARAGRRGTMGQPRGPWSPGWVLAIGVMVGLIWGPQVSDSRQSVWVVFVTQPIRGMSGGDSFVTNAGLAKFGSSQTSFDERDLHRSPPGPSSMRMLSFMTAGRGDIVKGSRAPAADSTIQMHRPNGPPQGSVVAHAPASTPYFWR